MQCTLDWPLRVVSGATIVCQLLVATCCPEHRVCQSEEVSAYQPVAPLGVRAFYRQGLFLATRRRTLDEDQASSLALALLLPRIQTLAEG